MNIIAVDDERRALNRIVKVLAKSIPDADVTVFMSAKEAIEHAKDNRIDIAFLDIEMGEMNGLVLAKKLKDIYGDTNIIFITGHSQYGLDAFEIHASGYVMKPISEEDVARELENLRNPIMPQDTGVRIQCFGNFEVFVDGIPVSFSRTKSKEALAYLVDRNGAGTNKKEIAAILLGNAPYTRSTQSYIHIILSEMIRALKEVGAAGIIIKKHNLYAVDTAKFNCDYYSYDKGDASAVNRYHGEYMANYDWAEFTAAHLSNQKTIK
ncbi:response regulator [Christensenellaceae bacterium OttesenSCG-928-K19]|nr:response regulator [Christensenellaceae bacterium OttesenSCG-928-K19]